VHKDESHWLEPLRADLASVTAEAARYLWPSPDKNCPPFFNYRLEHVRQVEREALALLDLVGGDREVVLASVWLHDRFQPAFVGPDHGKQAATWAAENLTALSFPAEKVEAVCFAVANHSNPPGSIPSAAHEARVLWDADKLTKLGAVEILFTLLNNLASDRLRAVCSDRAFPERTITIESLVRIRLRELGRGESPAHHFYFEPSRRWAAERFEMQKSFYASLCQQVGEPLYSSTR
jgi:hypothetical protein